ncbi:hypothetical protein [Clostridium sp. Cult1]|jgi:hypothetical protein|uniref:hypothetical protein n=1 Tax=Clostridium sp. Cult1 TaxID=2079002 RepID=UPI001F161F75|nr:hypothetical protein [Clostridium sp. Cult1]MCF6463422.1 hypothetical protein [Clostridium sp. Cult1]
MDWSKAKTILIVAFIITNILLIYVIVGEDHVNEPTLKDDFIEDVVELLEDKNIKVSTQIPKDIPHLNTMVVEYENVNIQKLNKDYFSNRGNIEQNAEGLGKIKKDGESFLIMNNRFIIYENKNKIKLYNDLNKDEAIRLAEEFINKGKFKTSDMKLTFVKEEEGTFYLEYSKIHEDVLVERTFTNLQVDSRGVKRFERLWLNEKELGEAEIYISTAPKAILTLLGMQEIYGKTITDISLCYYFDPEKHDYLGEPTNAKQGRAIPAWRIQFDDGYKIFIDEYL